MAQTPSKATPRRESGGRFSHDRTGAVVERPHAGVVEIPARHSAEGAPTLLMAGIDQTDDAVLLAADGVIRYVNPAFVHLFGHPADDFVGRPVSSFASLFADPRARDLRGATEAAVNWSGPLRLRAADGAELVTDVTVTHICGRAGQTTGLVAVLREVTARLHAEEALRTSEERFRLLAERSSDVIYRFRLRPTPGFEYVSPSATAVTSYTPEEHYADPMIGVHPEDRKLVDDIPRLLAGPVCLRWVRKDGSTIWLEQTTVPEYDEAGQIVALEGTARDVTARVAAENALRASEERFRAFLSRVQAIALIVDPESKIIFANEYLLARSGWSWEEIAGRDFFEMFVPPAERDARRAATAGARTAVSERRSFVTRSGELRVIEYSGMTLHDASGQALGSAFLGQDVTEQIQTQQERDRLATAVEQAPAVIAITDRAGTLVYANQELELMTGYRVADITGRPVFEMMHGLSPEGHETMWQRLQRGEVVAGDWQAERADGSLFRAEGSISPVRDPSGTISHFIFVARDVTRLREAEAALAVGAQERAAIAAALANLKPGGTAEATAQAIAVELRSLPWIDFAAVVGLLGDEAALILGLDGPASLPIAAGDRLPESRAVYLHERARQGPWSEIWRARPEDGVHGQRMAEAGVKAVAYGPFGDIERPLGLLMIGATSDEHVGYLVEHLPAIAEFGATANALLAGPLEGRRGESSLRAALEGIIAARAFHPVFQSIHDLEEGTVVGYEALTRFDSGQRPDLCFAEAWSVGLGPELEFAALEAAVHQARRLPAGRWLDLNLSPRLLEDPDQLRRILWPADRPIVLEITEHELVADYGALRAAVRALGRDIRLAVDDAGAGIANFGHIVELRPDLVKLDISLVRRVNANLGRQALVVAMRHFARTAGCRLVAEGIEAEAEATTLASLGVEFGQGYWFGHPQPVEAFVAVSRSRRKRRVPRSSTVPG